MSRRAAALRGVLYPELEREDLNTFVKRLVRERGYATTESGRTYSIRVEDRFSQPAHAALERLFLFDLWSKGVCYGNFKIDDPHTMADVIAAFVVERMSIDELERRFPWLGFGAHARAHERGRLVEHVWQARVDSSEPGATPLREVLGPLLRACATRPRLRALLPFTSHDRLLFSRTTGYPYDAMGTYARPATREADGSASWLDVVVPGRFCVVRRAQDHQVETPLGEGDAAWAAATLEQDVPAGWGPAVDGTSDDAAGASRGAADAPDEAYNDVFRAIASADMAALRAALLAGTDVNAADLRPYLGHLNTPLHHAASLGNAEMVRVLLDAAANVDARCADGWTPLMRACNAGALEATRLLVEAGADLEAENSEGYTAYDRIPGNAAALLAFMRSRLTSRTA